ncbi:unnamed protein product [Lota lota]
MSQVGVASTNLHEAFPVTTLTILILSLIPCVLILLVLNCLFLAYKLLNISKNKRQNHQQASEEMLLHSCVSTRHRVARITEAPFFQNQGRRIHASMSEPTLPQPVTSSRTSSQEKPTGEHGMRFLRPDGAIGTGLGSLTAPSTILANSAASGCTSRVDRNVKILNKNKLEWCRSLLLRQSSDSDGDTRSDHVPPNSPEIDSHNQFSKLTKNLDLIRNSSTLESLANINDDLGPPLHLFDKVELECEYPLHNNSARMRSSCLSTSMVGPGLDSDFGASAGVSLRIVSADSDDLTNGVVAAALEWDYYDPCYVQQNSVPIHKPSRPSIHSKQYWV